MDDIKKLIDAEKEKRSYSDLPQLLRQNPVSSSTLVFQKPQEFQAAKYLNLNVRQFQSLVNRNQLFTERWTAILGAELRPQSTAGSAYNWRMRG